MKRLWITLGSVTVGAALLCGLAAKAHAETYYVAADGAAGWASCEDAAATPGPKSGAAACDLATANANAVAGDTVYLREGTYTLDGTAIDPAQSGEQGSPLTFSAYEDEVVELVNTSSSGAAYAVNLNSDNGPVRSYVVVQGLRFVDFNRHLWILRGSYNEIAHCVFDGTLNQTSAGLDWRGSTLYRNAHHNHVHHCTFRNYGAFDGDNDHGVLLEIGIDGSGDDDTHRNLIEHNELAHGGHHVLGIHGHHNVIRNNYLHNEAWWPEGGAQYGNRIIYMVGDLPGCQRNLIEGNRIAYGGETAEPDQIGGSGGTFANPYNIIRRNQFYHCLIYGMFLYNYGYAGGRDNRIYHNAYWHNGYSTTGPAKGNWDTAYTHAIYVAEAADSVDDNVIANNIFYENLNERGAALPIIEPHPEYDEPDLQQLVGNWIGATDGDPAFVSIAGTPDPGQVAQFDLQLQAGSGAIDNAPFLTTVTSADGSGTEVAVADAGFFMDGWEIVSGDLIQLEGQTERVRVTGVDYDSNTLTVESELSWSQGQGVSLAYEGTAPDQGAFEYGFGGEGGVGPGGGGPGGAGGTGGTGGAGQGGAGGSGAQAAATTATEDDSGCGCRVAISRRRASWLLLAWALLWMRRRRS